MIPRRTFIAGLGAAAAWPLAARGQQQQLIRRVAAMLRPSESEPEARRYRQAFEQTLESLGWIGSRTLQIDYFWGIDTVAKGNEAASKLLKLSPEVILAGIGPALIAAKATTNTVPIVFTLVSEPVNRGFVQSLAHPGGNVTGFTNMEPSIGSKWLELLKEIAPETSRVALVFNPGSGAAAPFADAIVAAAKTYSVEVVVLPIHGPTDIAKSIEIASQQPKTGIITLPDGFSQGHRDLFVELTARYRVPAVYASRFFADAGGLISYAPDFVAEFGEAARYVDRILRGEKPADLPVQQPTKFELVINLKTAKALGLTVPLALQAAADQVIE